VVNAAEAEVVRQLFSLYLQHGCLSAVTRAADDLGLRSKRHFFSTGREQGGNRMSQGQIHRILTNPVYLGRIRHKEKSYPSAHPAIIDETLWTEVQNRLQQASARRRGAIPGAPVEVAAPLKGRFRDETGNLLTPTHTDRGNKRLRYYVSNRLISGGTDPVGWRLPARDFEATVARTIASHLELHARRYSVLASADASASSAASDRVGRLAEHIRGTGILAAAPLIREGCIAAGQLSIRLDAGALSEAAGLRGADIDPALLQIAQPFHCRRRGIEMKIVAGDRVPAPDATLIRALRNAHDWAGRLRAGTPLSVLARAEGVSERYMARIIHLAGLSPRIQDAIAHGRQPVDLTLKDLLRTHPPLDWDVQEREIGFTG
jgi:hypothetical protein